jgi:hypothetical protein
MSNESNDFTSSPPSLAPPSNETMLDIAEEEHEFDAVSALLINVTLIGCLLLSYYVKKFRLYALPESAGAVMVGMVVGGIARLCTNDLKLFEFVSLCCDISSLIHFIRRLSTHSRFFFVSYCHMYDLLIAFTLIISHRSSSFSFYSLQLFLKRATPSNAKPFLKTSEPSLSTPWSGLLSVPLLWEVLRFMPQG